MRAPYYKVYIGSRDITEFIESIDYEDTTEQDNLITLQVDREYALVLADDEDFVTGAIISIRFGFMQGTLSELHEARMTDITHTYKERVRMKIVCLDLGTAIKKTTSQKIWEGMTTSQIAEQIATKHGLESEIAPTTKVWDNMPQGNRSDLELLKYLVQRDGNGNNIIFIRNRTLYLTERANSEESIISYTYRKGDGVLVSFTPTVKESSKDGSFNQTATVHVDDSDGAVSASVVDGSTEEATGTTGTHKLVYGSNNGEQVGDIFDNNTTVGKPNLSPVEDMEEATSLANSTKKKQSQRVMTAKLVVEGSPLLTPNAIVTITNVARRHMGNWLITKVSHRIQQTSYVTTCELSSNGAKSSSTSTTPATDNNTSEGSERLKDEVKVGVFRAEDGKRVGFSSSSSSVKRG